MSIAIFHGKQQYVLGFLWRHENTKPSFNYIKSLAIESGNTNSVVRQSLTGAWQVGLGSLSTDENKLKSGSRSLAAAITDSTIESISLLCKLDNDLYWYFAARDGEVLPDGDFVGNKYDCQRIRAQYMDIGAWDVLEECDISEAFLRVVLNKQGPGSKVKSALQQTSMVPFAIVFFIIIAGSIGYWFWHKHQEEEAFAKKLAMMRRKREAEAMAIAQEKLIPPWTKNIDTATFLAYCGRVWSHTYPFVAGWSLNKWSCSVGSDTRITVTSEYVNAGGLAVDAPGSLKFGTNKISVDTFISEPFSARDNEGVFHLVSKSKASRQLFSVADELHGMVKIGADIGSPVLPGVSSAKDIVVGNSFNFTWESDYSPFIRGLDHELSFVSVTVLNGMTWLSDGKWRLAGVTYFVPGVDRRMN